MKIGVIMAGASRPSSKRIIENIHNTISFFRSTYPRHTFDFIVCTYTNEGYTDILHYCESNKIINHFIEPIKDSDIPKELDRFLCADSPDLTSKNRYRMFYSMNYVVNKLADDYDGVIRLRIDAEIKSFDLSDSIKPGVYYTVLDSKTSCSDNIGYARPDVMKNVWDLKNCFVKAVNNETLVYNAIAKHSYRIEQFKFNYIMYQDNSEYFNGVKQWSKRNREWIYDGTDYIRGRTV